MPRLSKAELALLPPPIPRTLSRMGLWALVQTHRYGQSICAEVLAPNKSTARSLFDTTLSFTEAPGQFFIARLYYELHPVPYAYVAKMKPRTIRFVKGVVYDDSPPPSPQKIIAPANKLLPPTSPSHSRNLTAYKRRPYRSNRSRFRDLGPLPKVPPVNPQPDPKRGRVPARPRTS